MLLEGCSLFLFGHVLVLGSGEVLKRLGYLRSFISCLLDCHLLSPCFRLFTEPSPQRLHSCVLFCLERVPLPPLDCSSSSFQAHVKCHLLQEAFLDTHHVTLLCVP